jgi:hypothetical protein
MRSMRAGCLQRARLSVVPIVDSGRDLGGSIVLIARTPSTHGCRPIYAADGGGAISSRAPVAAKSPDLVVISMTSARITSRASRATNRAKNASVTNTWADISSRAFSHGNQAIADGGARGTVGFSPAFAAAICSRYRRAGYPSNAGHIGTYAQ